MMEALLLKIALLAKALLGLGKAPLLTLGKGPMLLLGVAATVVLLGTTLMVGLAVVLSLIWSVPSPQEAVSTRAVR